MNLLSIHLTRNPTVEECATALRVIFIVAGPAIFEQACDKLPGLPDIAAAPVAPSAPVPPAVPGVAAAPPAPSIDAAGFGNESAEAPANDGPVPTVDKNGVPWDERIHAGTKVLSQDGTWRRRRGIQDSEFDKITAELKGRSDIGNIPAALDRRTPAAPAAPSAPAAPVPPAPPAPAASHDAPADSPTNFAAFMRAAGAYLPGNRITMGEINEICTQLGYPSPMEIKNTPDQGASLFPIAFEMVKEKAASKGAK